MSTQWQPVGKPQVTEVVLTSEVGGNVVKTPAIGQVCTHRIRVEFGDRVAQMELPEGFAICQQVEVEQPEQPKAWAVCKRKGGRVETRAIAKYGYNWTTDPTAVRLYGSDARAKNCAAQMGWWVDQGWEVFIVPHAQLAEVLNANRR